MAGRLAHGWQDFLLDGDCDVWLLTEVNESIELPGYQRHLGEARMAARRHWAGVYSRLPVQPLTDPQVASAAAVVDGITYCSTILAWKGATDSAMWPGDRHVDKTTHTLGTLLEALPRKRLVWGGDWNHALSGFEGAGSMGGRQRVLAAVEELGLQVPTADLPHRLDGHLTIDHVAVPRDWMVTGAERIAAGSLSDHDCYVVDVVP